MRKGIFLSLVIALLLVPSIAYGQTSFTDVNADFWAQEEIAFLHEQQIINGYENGSFQPNNNVTRAQTAIMIVNALNLETENRPNPQLKDIREDFHAYAEIAAVADEGIMTGNNGSFKPNAFLTRGEMAAVIDRTFDLEEATFETVFRDVQGSNTFYTYIQNLAYNQITTGYASDQTFRPNESTTRAQFSVFLARVLDDRFKPEDKAIPELDFFTAFILEAEDAIEGAMYEEWEKSFNQNQPLAPFETIKPIFLDYYSVDMVDTVWEPFYYDHLGEWGSEISQLNPFKTMEDLRLYAIEPNYVVISGTEPISDINPTVNYYEYNLFRVDGVWQIDHISGSFR